MDYKIVGQVTVEEKNEAVILTERLAALYELKLSEKDLDLSDKEKDNLLKIIAHRETETNKQIEQWWKERHEKYQWEGQENCKWEVDFKNCNVYLRTGSSC